MSLVRCMIYKKGKDELIITADSLWDLNAIDIDGNEVNIGELCHGKKAIIIVNTASK